MKALSWLESDSISLSPATWPSLRSRGVVTELAICWGDAPGWVAMT